ncbi:MAG: 50S ribosomal protein L11 methyltransferase [Lachnospiraceae bacterium]|nr:50S ribosomal protein L11 methyltransferase [Lachnospiraceae bacterium]
MEYTKYTIKTTVEAEDILSCILADNGIEGIEIADSKPWSKEELDEIFVDEVPLNKDIPEGQALISFYLSEEDDKDTILSGIRAALEDMRARIEVPCGDLSISSSELDDEDYLNSWKKFFHSFDIILNDGRTLSIVPSWEEADHGKDSDILLHIDPGTAFGTGAHETTKLCIIMLSKYLSPGMKVLDLGTGSGILSMAAFKLGASCITATDIDPNSLPAVEDNFTKNDLNDTDFTMLTGNAVTDQGFRADLGNDYDIVVANILPVVLTPLTPVMKEMVRPGGIVIYSGILTEKAPAVRQTLEENSYKVLEEDTLGEWCVIVSVYNG